MAYTTINKHTDYFNTKLYTGNGTTDHAITGVGFQPDLNWIKKRSTSDNHIIHQVGFNAGDYLRSNTSDGLSNSGEMTKSLDSDGFTVGTRGEVNTNNSTFVSWNWKANGAGSSNTDGSITSTVSANTTAGFSIVTWTGNNTGGATVGHGLGAVPKMIIFRNYSVTEDWTVYHHKLANNNYKLDLNNSSAQANVTNPYMENTTPTSSLITLGDHQRTNGSGNSILAYCFAEKTGYSKFGEYKANNSSNGTFIYTGFAPSWILIKNAHGGTNSGTASWVIHDNKRDPKNPSTKYLYPDLNNAEADNSAHAVDLLSNGFKIRNTTANENESGATYIYMAFGQSLVGSNNVPCTAR